MSPSLCVLCDTLCVLCGKMRMEINHKGHKGYHEGHKGKIFNILLYLSLSTKLKSLLK